MTGLMRKRDSLLSEAQHLSVSQRLPAWDPWWPEEKSFQCYCMQRFMVMIDGFGDLWSLIRYQYHFLPSYFFFFYLISLKCFILMPLLGRAAAADDGNGKMMPKMVMEMKRWWFYLPEKLTIRHNQGWKQFVKNDCFLSNRNPKSLGHSYVNNKWFHRM